MLWASGGLMFGLFLTIALASILYLAIKGLDK